MTAVSKTDFNLDINNLTLDDIPNFTEEDSKVLDRLQADYKGDGTSGVDKATINRLQFLEAADRLRDEIEAGEFSDGITNGDYSEAKRKALKLLARAYNIG